MYGKGLDKPLPTIPAGKKQKEKTRAGEGLATRSCASTLMKIGVVLPKGGKMTDPAFLSDIVVDTKRYSWAGHARGDGGGITQIGR